MALTRAEPCPGPESVDITSLDSPSAYTCIRQFPQTADARCRLNLGRGSGAGAFSVTPGMVSESVDGIFLCQAGPHVDQFAGLQPPVSRRLHVERAAALSRIARRAFRIPMQSKTEPDGQPETAETRPSHYLICDFAQQAHRGCETPWHKLSQWRQAKRPARRAGSWASFRRSVQARAGTSLTE